MSNTNGTNSLARSMNGIITYDDGAGTLIQNGTIITNNFTVQNFNALNAIISGSIKCNIIDGLNDLTQSDICTLFNNEVNGIIYIGCANTTIMYIGYNTNINKILYLGSHASDIFLGGFKFLNNDMNMADDMQDMNIANTQYTGNLNIGTYVNRSGQIRIGNISNTNIIGDIKIISNAINLDVNADFIIGDELLNFNTLYLGNLVNRNVIGGLLVVDNVLDTNIGTSILNIGSTNATTINITPTGNLHLGSSTSTTTYIRNSNNLVIGQTPDTYHIYNTLAGNGASIYTKNNASIFDMWSSSWAGNNPPSSRIYSYGGTDSTNSGALTISSGTINIEPKGNLTMGSATSNVAIKCTEHFMIGANSTASSGGTVAGPVIELGTVSTINYIDFHCQPSFANDYDCRIRADAGATGTNGQGSLSYYAGSHAMTASAGNIALTASGTINLTAGTVDIQDMRFIGGQLYPKTSQTLYLGNANCPTISIGGGVGITSNIAIGVAGTTTTTINGTITLGNSTNTNTIGGIRVVGNAIDTAVMLDDLNIGISNAGKLNIGGQSPTVFGGLTRITGSVIDLASAGTLTIGSLNTTLLNVGVAGTVALSAPSILIGSTSTTTTITIGNASINPVKIQTSDRVVMGINPSSYNTTTGTLSGAGVIVGTNGTGPYNAFVDFYSYAGTVQSNSARIMSNNGGLTISNNNPSQPFNITSSQNLILSSPTGNGIYSTGGTHNFQSGMCYSKGNLTSAFFTQTYSSGMIGPAIPGNTVSPTSLSYTFPTAFSSTPVITLSTQNNTLNGASWGIILSVIGVSTTGVVLVAYNAKNSAVAVNSWGYNLIAVGGW